VEKTLAWAAAGSAALLPLLYPVLGLRMIIRGLNPPTLYWRRRLRLNLMETNLGMFLNLGLAVAVALLVEHGNPAGLPLMVLAALVDVVYTVWIVALTPSDWWHALPTGVAALLYGVAWLA
jgi:hypothetical protein